MGVRNRAEGINSSLRGISAGCSSESGSSSPCTVAFVICYSRKAEGSNSL